MATLGWLLYRASELRGRVIVLPVASVEEHGCLPAATDYLLGLCLGERLEGVEGVAVLPPLPYTLCAEHPVCIDAGEAWRLEAYLEAVAASAARISGAGVVLAVTHGGAYHAAYAAARSVSRSTRVRVAVVNVVEEAVRGAGRAGCLEHAGVVEASMLAACGVWLGDCMAAGLEAECLEPGSVQPWMHSDYRCSELYPSRIAASRELGEKAWRTVVERIRLIAGRLLSSR
ncbi:MAG: creatininase family protein [Crenarchaeota archaeon]|nr:creatininase family protein [Thermoproteota archaeon]